MRLHYWASSGLILYVYGFKKMILENASNVLHTHVSKI